MTCLLLIALSAQPAISREITYLGRGDLSLRARHTRAVAPAVRTVRVGQNPTALAVDVHTRRVFVVNQGPLYRNGAGTARGYGSVSMLDATTGTLLRTTRVGQNPRAVAIDERTGRVFVVDEGPLSADRSGLPTADGTVSVLDATTGKPLRTTRVGVGASAAAVDVQTGRVFVANAGPTLGTDLHNPKAHGSVSILDATSGAILSTVSTGAGTHALAVDEHNGHVLVSTGVVLDAHTGVVLHTVTPRGGPYDALAVDANVGHAVAVTTAVYPVVFYILSVLETGSGRIIRTFEVDTIQSGGAATVTVDTVLHHAFAVTGGVVTVLNTRNAQARHTMHLGPLVAVAVDAPLAWVFVAEYNYALPRSHGILPVLDARSGRLFGRIVLGVGPNALAVDAPSRHLFVANRGENTVSMLALRP